MDGIHDLGGRAGFGSIEVEANEPTFHAPWESTAWRLLIGSIAALKAFNTDEYRHSIERIPPVEYLSARYYERVLTGVTTLLIEKGYVDLDDLERRAGGRFPIAQPVRPNSDDGIEAPATARFAVGDRVRVRDMHQPGHTRAPAYVHGREGIVVHVAPPFGYPDASAHGLPGRREPTYHVEFAAEELWGEDSETDTSVVVDLWESYLEAER